MDPLWVFATEAWWVAPAAGTGILAAVGLRRRGAVNGRRLAYDAARLELQAALRHAAASRMQVKVARAEHARVVAERAASRATSADVVASRRQLGEIERASKAAAADIRFRRARVSAARAALGGGSELPLQRLHHAHDAVIARWMEYETDPAKLISYPSMSDVRVSETAAFLLAADRAKELRRALDAKRPAPADFSAYRDAVAALERSFDVAERVARGQTGAPRFGRDSAGWQETAQSVIARSADAVDRAAGAAASVISAWNARPRSARPDPAERPAPTPPAAPGSGTRNPPPGPVWPVPRRDGS